MYYIQINDSANDYTGSVCSNEIFTIFEEEVGIDSGIYRLYFESSIVDDSYSDSVNYYILSYLLDLYNGIRLLRDEYPLKYNINSTFTLNDSITAYEIINNYNWNLDSQKKLPSEIIKMLKNKETRDLFVLLSNVSKMSEHSLVNYYRIYDYYKMVCKKYYDNEKNIEIKELDKDIRDLNKYVNQYSLSGIFSRHGYQAIKENIKIKDGSTSEDKIFITSKKLAAFVANTLVRDKNLD